MSGRLAFASPPDAIAAMFPAASRWLGPRRVAALAATTLLVGMVCPGLHSIYAGFTVEACDEAVAEDRLGFRVTATDPRVRSVQMTVAGGGLAGAVQSYARMPPTPQASMQDLADLVEPGEFSGAAALIIGGSRGLGEVTAKLLAAGGARVAISYRVGGAEAEAVAQEIRSGGGVCETLAYDASLSSRAATGRARRRADARLLLRHPEDLRRAVGAVRSRAAGRVSQRLRRGISQSGGGAEGATQGRLPLLSVIGGRGGAAARHARIRHGQSGGRNALRRDESGVASASRHGRSPAAPAHRPNRLGHWSEPRLPRSVDCWRSCGRRSHGRARPKSGARRTAPLQTGSAG